MVVQEMLAGRRDLGEDAGDILHGVDALGLRGDQLFAQEEREDLVAEQPLGREGIDVGDGDEPGVGGPAAPGARPAEAGARSSAIENETSDFYREMVRHGRTSHLTPARVDDLATYLLSL